MFSVLKKILISLFGSLVDFSRLIVYPFKVGDEVASDGTPTKVIFSFD